MYNSIKRIASVSMFVVLIGVLVPMWSSSQDTTMQYRLGEHDRQLQGLSTVPVDIAVIKEKVAQLQSAVESIKTTSSAIILALLGWLVKEMFEFFGGKFGLVNRNKGVDKPNG